MITSYRLGSSILTAPTFTNSAVTPASRRLTSSRKAGGNDHSRPTNRPTRFVMMSSLVAAASGRDQSCPPMYCRIIRSQ